MKHYYQSQDICKMSLLQRINHNVPAVAVVNVGGTDRRYDPDNIGTDKWRLVGFHDKVIQMSVSR